MRRTNQSKTTGEQIADSLGNAFDGIVSVAHGIERGMGIFSKGLQRLNELSSTAMKSNTREEKSPLFSFSFFTPVATNEYEAEKKILYIHIDELLDSENPTGGFFLHSKFDEVLFKQYSKVVLHGNFNQDPADQKKYLQGRAFGGKHVEVNEHFLSLIRKSLGFHGGALQICHTITLPQIQQQDRSIMTYSAQAQRTI